MTMQSKSVADIYTGVVQDVVDGVKQAFEDESDETTLLELKNLWESKLRLSKALDPASDPRQLTNMYNANLHRQMNPIQRTTHVTPLQMNNTNHQILTIGNHQLSGSANIAAQALPRNMYHHLANLNYIVPPGGNSQPYLFHPQTRQFLTPTIINSEDNMMQSQPQALLKKSEVVQLDGPNDDSSDDDFDDDGDNDVEDDAEEAEEPLESVLEVEEEPLNSDDDETDGNQPGDIFEADNVVVCQFDKINRSKAKWKFHLKDGIMNLAGRDYLFQKATGDADF